jgi:hypothetical protein
MTGSGLPVNFVSGLGQEPKRPPRSSRAVSWLRAYVHGMFPPGGDMQVVGVDQRAVHVVPEAAAGTLVMSHRLPGPSR